MFSPKSTFRAAPRYQPLLRMVGIDAESVFADPRIKPWRSLPDRENCTLDEDLPDGRHVRFHVKRYAPARGFGSPADDEANGLRALEAENIPTAPLVGWGKLADGRSFVIVDDLSAHRPADKLVADGTLPFEALLEPTADLAALLHARGLHHRDLYLCHFFAKAPPLPAGSGGPAPAPAPAGADLDLRLIDAARVRRLPGFLTRRRWIVKDLAQFWYSTQQLGVTDEQRDRWLARYAQQRGLASPDSLRKCVERKARRIARHDARLRAAQPRRNISLPGA